MERLEIAIQTIIMLSVAQMEEHLRLNQEDSGSDPSGHTAIFPTLLSLWAMPECYSALTAAAVPSWDRGSEVPVDWHRNEK